jgi:DNA-binding GntR family transcriptional regulator
MKKRMKTKSLSEEAVFLRLRQAIGSRQLSPGTRLREAQICDILGASRGKVRKALARLAHEGLVDLTPNRGASVARPTARDAADLFAARKCIEMTIARMAATRMTPYGLAGLEAHLDLEAQARESGNTDAIILLSGEFHMLLADMAGNTTLKRYLEDIVFRESLIIQLYEKHAHDSCPGAEHRLILEALKAEDPDLLAKRIEDHIDTIAAGLDLSPRPQAEKKLEDILSDI